MSLFFILVNHQTFHEQLAPPLAQSWRRRSFAPCRALCQGLLPLAAEYARRYQLTGQEPLLAGVLSGRRFDRQLWRMLVSEVLTFAATEIPALKTAPQTLTCLLAAGQPPTDQLPPRAQLAPVQQAHFGSRDLAFGLGFYRPDQAGYNDCADVGRLADYLDTIDPARWRGEQLVGTAAAERAEELEFARECFAQLHELYRGAREGNQLVVCEEV